MHTFTLSLPAVTARPLALCALWAAPAAASALSLALSQHSALRASILVLLLITATLAAALLPALLARTQDAASRMPTMQTPAWTAAAIASADLSLSTLTTWAGGSGTPHWFACILVLATATTLIAKGSGQDADDDLWTDPDAPDRANKYSGSLG